MRITAAEKEATRRAIVQSALELFRTHGFEATTTRDIARSAGIATGTLFNYFATKDAIVLSLAEEAMRQALEAARNRRPTESFEEDLFALISGELRRLKPLRTFIRPLLDAALSPLAASDGAPSLRAAHLEMVVELANRHRRPEPSAVALQLFWTLQIGVLNFWARDKSPKQEETLALLDQSLAMWANWVRSEESSPSEER